MVSIRLEAFMWKKAFIRSFTACLAGPFSFHRKLTIELWNWLERGVPFVGLHWIIILSM